MNGVTARLARWVSAMAFEDLPSSTVQKVKEILLDSIGCALGGYVTERAKIALQLGEAYGTKPEATVIGYRKLSCPAASFVNGELINSLDFDAVGPLLGHVVPQAMPPALAMAERIEAGGRDLITALAVAIEVGNRVGGSISGLKWPKDEPPYYEEAPRASCNSAIFGGVAGACELFKMREEEISSAFGVGGTTTPIPGNVKWEYSQGVNLKYGCWTGWVAMLGTIAALAVQRGFRGDETILDGKHGYWQMYGSPFFKEDVLLGDLGTVWHLERINFKAYPCCYINHAAIGGIEHLVRENNVKSEDIEEIVVYGDPLHNTPNRWPPQIRTQEDAQFAEAYLYALAASHESTPGPEWQLPSSLSNPRVRDLMPKVKVRLHPKAEEMLTEKAKAGGVTDLFSSIVEISASGRKITTEVSVPKGSPANPMSAAELEDKFRLNASYCLVKRENVDPIIEIISNLEEVDNITKLTRLLNIEE